MRASENNAYQGKTGKVFLDAVVSARLRFTTESAHTKRLEQGVVPPPVTITLADELALPNPEEWGKLWSLVRAVSATASAEYKANNKTYSDGPTQGDP